MSLSIPLPALAKILEDSEGSKFRSILQTLRSVNYVNQSLLKSDIAVFIAKVLKLLRSNDPYQIWKGCHVVSVFCSHNPVVLCSQSNQLLTVLYTRLEAFVSYYSETAQSPARLTTLKTLTRTVDILMDLIRGKPTLTREASFNAKVKCNHSLVDQPMPIRTKIMFANYKKIVVTKHNDV